MVRITLDAETFKALASPTRLTVLRALDERRKTLTEISRDLSLNKATVHEHLQLLAAADLVRKRDDEGRKWIYYELTWRGQKLLHPQETTTFNVLLGLGVAAAGGGLAMLARSLYLAMQPAAPVEPFDDDGKRAAPMALPGEATANSNVSTASSTSTGSPGAGQSAPPENAALVADSGPTEPPAAAEADFLDEGGLLGLALVGFSALMGLFAWLLRRHLRADPFRPPQGEPAPDERA